MKKTENIENVKRRMAAHRQRLRDAGLKPREVWASDAENDRLKGIMGYWRGDENNLDLEQQKAALVLKPD